MYHLIINPTAGNGRAERIGQQIESALKAKGMAYQSYRTTHRGHATALARACVQQGATRVICIGGDGTAFEVANGLSGSQAALGILPAGTGNDFVRSLCMPKDPMAGLELLLEAPAMPVNICTINDGVFLNVCGAGFDVKTLLAAERAKKYARGMLPYLYGVLHTIINFRPTRLSVSLDGGPMQERELLLIAMANGQYYGGGMRIAPMARLDDDLLDVIFIKPCSRPRILALLPTFINGSFVRFTDLVEHVRCQTIEIAGQDLYIQTDGEIRPMSHARLSAQGAKQLLLVPKSAQNAVGQGNR